MKKAYQFAASISRFASDVGISVKDACELHRLSARAFKDGERYAGGKGSARAEQLAGEKVEQFAERFGLSVQWPGLWPTFVKGGYDYHLPAGG